MSFRGPGGGYFELQEPVRSLPRIEDVFYHSTINEALFDPEGAQARRDARLRAGKVEAASFALEVTERMLADLGASPSSSRAPPGAGDFPRVYAAQDVLRQTMRAAGPYQPPFPNEGLFIGALVGCCVLNKDGKTSSFYLFEFSDPHASQSFAPEENREILGLLHLHNKPNEMADYGYPLAVSLSPHQRRAGVYERVGGNFVSATSKTFEVESIEFAQA